MYVSKLTYFLHFNLQYCNTFDGSRNYKRISSYKLNEYEYETTSSINKKKIYPKTRLQYFTPFFEKEE